jgi:hypothetical protein
MNFTKVIQLTVLPLLFSFCLVSIMQGQQEPNFSQYMFYGLTMNPAVAGNDNAVSITAANRIQWTGFGKEDGEQVAPRTYFIAADLPIRILKGGVGAVIMLSVMKEIFRLKLVTHTRERWDSENLALAPR